MDHLRNRNNICCKYVLILKRKTAISSLIISQKNVTTHRGDIPESSKNCHPAGVTIATLPRVTMHEGIHVRETC